MLQIVEDDPIVSWNGSHLGAFDEDDIVQRVDTFPYKLYIVRVHTEYVYCAMHSCKNKLPCIIDEIKPVFGLVKIGTHSAFFGKKMYIMYRMTTRYPIFLKDIRGPHSESFSRMVQEVFVFRLVCGLGSNFETSIIMIDGVPSSYRNKVDINDDRHSILPNNVRDKWFKDDIELCIKRMVKHSGRSINMRTSIQDIICRIDKNLIWMDNVIFDRLLKLK